MAKICILIVALALCLHAGYTFDCPGRSCLRNAKGDRMTIRVKYIPSDFVVVNTKTKDSIAKGPSICDSADSAVPACFDYHNWNGGWIGVFMYQVLQDIGVEVVALTGANTSAEIKSLHADAYSQCIAELSSGYVDLCVGYFWETAGRRNVTSFTTSLGSETFYLYTMPSPLLNPSFQASDLVGIFAPFESAVWMLLLICVIFFSIVLWIIEATNNSKDYTADLSGFVESVYQTTLAFVGGEHIANFLPSRIVKVGLGLLVYVYMNSYIASFASHFVVDNKVPVGIINSLEDLRTSGQSLCVVNTMMSVTAGMFPPALNVLQMDDYGPMLEKLYTGYCSGAVISQQAALFYIAAASANFTVCTDPADTNNFATCANAAHPPTTYDLNSDTCGSSCSYIRRYCDLVQLTDPTVSAINQPIALPIRRDLAPYASAAIMAGKDAGNLTAARTQELYLPNPTVCAGPSPKGNSLTPRELSGAYLVCGVLIALGGLVHAASLLTFRFAARAHEKNTQGSWGSSSHEFSLSRRASSCGDWDTRCRRAASIAADRDGSIDGGATMEACAGRVEALLAKAAAAKAAAQTEVGKDGGGGGGGGRPTAYGSFIADQGC